jgi:serine/threonine protein phosphatase 1
VTRYNKAPQKDYRFASINGQHTVWAIPSIHGQIEELFQIHDHIFRHFKLGDTIIYLGNYTGYSLDSAHTINEILAFRRSILTIQGVMPQDIIYLRGAQEEMMQKLMQIQFAPNPRPVIEWMLASGMAGTLQSYGVDIDTLRRVAGQGVVALSRWTDYLRSTIRRNPGHEIFAQQYYRAALKSNIIEDNGLMYQAAPENISALFVSGGIDFSRALEDQGDNLWWGKDDFTKRTTPYTPFAKVIRGYDNEHKGLHLNCVTATLDNNCGFNGRLICAEIRADNEIRDVVEARH